MSGRERAWLREVHTEEEQVIMIHKRVDPIIAAEGTEEIRPGRVVQLRSGGMRMTVEKVVAPDSADCVWHVPSGAVLRDSFPLETLLVLLPRAEPEPAPEAKPGEA
jgi:uncharacterized protein YodC (DUF2158 family)